jgi:hypothetical protein
MLTLLAFATNIRLMEMWCGVWMPRAHKTTDWRDEH